VPVYESAVAFRSSPNDLHKRLLKTCTPQGKMTLNPVEIMYLLKQKQVFLDLTVNEDADRLLENAAKRMVCESPSSEIIGRFNLGYASSTKSESSRR
jgi:hypothetical protein